MLVSQYSSPSKETERNKIKCVVWDLDNTLWNGTLLENDQVSLREDVLNIIKTLDSRGILQSVASRNDYATAMAKLRQFKIDEYFLYPQINWNSKADSIRKFRDSINVGIDTIAFIDDQAFEREEVNFTLPEVLCIDSANLHNILDMPEFKPKFITSDSKMRRMTYLNDIKRNKAEEQFQGPKEEFLASLDMILTISKARREDLRRAEELTLRTNQLNTTGYTYSYDELQHFSNCSQHKLLVSSLKDKFGTYGKIGLALISIYKDLWVLKLLLMSCRVMSRGIGTIMLNYILRDAKRNVPKLKAEIVPTDRNRMMYMTLKFAHFKEDEKLEDMLILSNDLKQINPDSRYVKIIVN